MSQYLISLDAWGTLIKSNPEFKLIKNDLIRKYSKFPNKEVFNDYFINDQINIIKHRHDSIIEEYGTQPNIRHLFAELCVVFSIPASSFNNFYLDYQREFQNNNPVLYSENTLDCLKEIKAHKCDLYLSSNTLFTSHESMLVVLGKLGLTGKRSPITNYRISGEKGFSKPHKSMFFDRTNIHVGDNPKTDGACIRYGIEFYQINTNQNTIKDFQDYVSLRG